MPVRPESASFANAGPPGYGNPSSVAVLSNASPGRVVQRVAEQAVATHAGHFEQLAMSAGHQQRDERKRRSRIGEQRRQQMALQMMDADSRLAERVAERTGDARADQQRAGQPGALRVRDRVDVAELETGFGQHALDQRHQSPDVIARCELGHDTAELGVHRHLGMQRVRQQAGFRVVDGNAGLVAGSLDAEDAHGGLARAPGPKSDSLQGVASLPEG
jgi:hypothetical protein